MKNNLYDRTNFLKGKALWLRKEVLRIHQCAPEIRIASCLSTIEIFIVLYYGRLLNYNFKNTLWQKRDRLVISKGHGAVALYPILADFGLLDKSDLRRICKDGSNLGSIPDCLLPGFEFITGSLGHGLGVACGMAIALKRRKVKSSIFVLMGDGELYEGSVWESIMFAAHYHLDNLILIIDNNKICMLDYCKNIIDMFPLDKKFEAFRWDVHTVDGHNVEGLYSILKKIKSGGASTPKVLIANTVKGKGAPCLETDPLCHVKSLKTDEVDRIVTELE